MKLNTFSFSILFLLFGVGLSVLKPRKKVCKTKDRKKYPACGTLKCFSALRREVEAECKKTPLCDGYVLITLDKKITSETRFSVCLKHGCPKGGKGKPKVADPRATYVDCTVKPRRGRGKPTRKPKRFPQRKSKPTTSKKMCKTKYRKKYPSCGTLKCYSALRREVEAECKKTPLCDGYVLITTDKRITSKTRFSVCLKHGCPNGARGKQTIADPRATYVDCTVKRRRGRRPTGRPLRSRGGKSRRRVVNGYSQYQSNNMMMIGAGIVFVSIGGIIAVFRNSRRRRQEEEYELIISDDV